MLICCYFCWHLRFSLWIWDHTILLLQSLGPPATCLNLISSPLNAARWLGHLFLPHEKVPLHCSFWILILCAVWEGQVTTHPVLSEKIRKNVWCPIYLHCRTVEPIKDCCSLNQWESSILGLLALPMDSLVIRSLLNSFWRRQWHSTPVLFPGKSHEWRSLVGCSPWGR